MTRVELLAASLLGAALTVPGVTLADAMHEAAMRAFALRDAGELSDDEASAVACCLFSHEQPGT